MKPPWKPPRGDRTDEELIRRKRKLAEKLAFAVEYGTEEEFVAAVNEFEPNMTKEKRKDLIMQFHAARREKRGL
jgi:hypothetical protein